MYYNYGMKSIVPKVVVSGVVINDGKVLVIQRAASDTHPGLWEIPGGGKEPLEKCEDAVKREVKEETGLTIEIKKLVGVFDYTTEKEDCIKDCTQINYLVKPIGKVEVNLSTEHEGFAWITENEINNYNISKETKEVIMKAFLQKVE